MFRCIETSEERASYRESGIASNSLSSGQRTGHSILLERPIARRTKQSMQTVTRFVTRVAPFRFLIRFSLSSANNESYLDKMSRRGQILRKEKRVLPRDSLS